MDWINVKDRLPELANKESLEYSNRCLVIDKIEGIQTAELFRLTLADVWYVVFKHDSDYELNNVTHWMPLPEPPKDTLELL